MPSALPNLFFTVPIWLLLSRAPHSGSCQLISDKVLPRPEPFAFYKKLLKQNNLHTPRISHWWQNTWAGSCLGFLRTVYSVNPLVEKNLKRMGTSHTFSEMDVDLSKFIIELKEWCKLIHWCTKICWSWKESPGEGLTHSLTWQWKHGLKFWLCKFLAVWPSSSR